MKINKRNFKPNPVCKTQFSQPSLITNSKIVRRKELQIDNLQQKRMRVVKQNGNMLVNYLGTSHVAQKSKPNLDHSISVNVSRKNSKQNIDCLAQNLSSCKRFRRNSEKMIQSPNPHFVEKQNIIDNNNCLHQHCEEQKHVLKRSIQTLRAKNNQLEKERNKLQKEVAECNEKQRVLQIKLNEKDVSLQQLQNIVNKRESTMQELMGQKSKEVIKLERTVSQLLKQIEILPTVKGISYRDEQATEKIISLSHELKYREIETHMLKKEKHDRSAMLHYIKTLEKENKVLKQRLHYLIQTKNKFEVEDLQSCSSLSLSISDISFQSLI